MVVLRDLTRLKRLERMRDEFLSTAAHELRTPITTIKGYAQLLDRWTPGGHEPREGKAFRILNRQSDRLTQLVQELLEVSRLQLGRLALRRQRFELGELVADVLERMQGVSSRHRLVLHQEGHVFVNADPERIDRDHEITQDFRLLERGASFVQADDKLIQNTAQRDIG